MVVVYVFIDKVDAECIGVVKARTAKAAKKKLKKIMLRETNGDVEFVNEALSRCDFEKHNLIS